MGYTAVIIISFLFLSSFTVDASWTKVPGYKFISGTSLGSETTYFGDLDYARPLCQQRCDDRPPCKGIRLYNFAGTVYCTLFENIRVIHARLIALPLTGTAFLLKESRGQKVTEKDMH